jgi:hypothetical protein
MEEKFPGKLTRSTKRSRGRTAIESTPIAIRSSVPIEPALEARIRKKLARRIGHAAPLIERGTVRFEDVNGPRGGVDTVCRIKLVVSGRPSVLAQDRGRDAEPAFDRASFKVQHALARVRGRHGLTTGQRYRGRGARKRVPTRTAVAVAARPHAPRKRASTRRAVAASARPHAPRERAPKKLKTARRAPSRKAVKSKARQAKRRVRVQRGARR